MTDTNQGLVRPRRRIGPGRKGSREYRRAVANNRHSIGMPAETLAEIEAGGIVLPDLDVVRRYRLQRVRDRLRDLGYAGIILYDPVHIRYACDTIDEFHHYSNPFHRVGMAHEWPMIVFPHAWDQAGYDGVVKPGMVLCVESYVARRGRGEGVKLQQQVLVTEYGHEPLPGFPIGLR